jgi:hypothetical protein
VSQTNPAQPGGSIVKAVITLEVVFVIAAAVITVALSPKNPYADTFGYRQNPLVDTVGECREFTDLTGSTGPSGICEWTAWEFAHEHDGDGLFYGSLIGLNVLVFGGMGLYAYNQRRPKPPQSAAVGRGSPSGSTGSSATVVCFACQCVVPRARRCRKCGIEIDPA